MDDADKPAAPIKPEERELEATDHNNKFMLNALKNFMDAGQLKMDRELPKGGEPEGEDEDWAATPLSKEEAEAAAKAEADAAAAARTGRGGDGEGSPKER